MNSDLQLKVQKLKSLPRTGWVRRGIFKPETLAAHMLSSQFLVVGLAKKRVKILSLALR